MAAANAIATIPEISFPFEIANISKLEGVWSHEVMIHGIPWKINVNKVTREGEQWLTVHLHCGIKDKSSDWSHVASATVKLKPVIGNKVGIERRLLSCIFDCSGNGFGFASFIKWMEVINIENNYVKDDTLTLDIKIEVADPNTENPSKLLLKTIEKCCNEASLVKYQLNVINIDQLIAVKSPQFKIRNLSWVFMVQKDSNHLYVTFHSRELSAKVSCKVQVSLKLVSSKKNVKSIEPPAQTTILKGLGILYVNKIITWDELLKPENGFVNDNSIVIEVEIKASEPEGVVLNNQNAPKRLKLECSICLDIFSSQEISTTQCGHLFCSACIKDSIKTREFCPSCNVAATLDSLRRVYLPIAN